MRICLYTNTALPRIGGQELVVDALGRHFTALGHEVVVLAPRPHCRGQLGPRHVPYRVAWHPRFRSARWFVPWHGQRLADLHRQWAFDVVHCHGVYPAAYLAASLPALGGVPLVVTSHGDDVEPAGLYYRKAHLRPRYRLVLERCDAAVATGRFTEDGYRAICPRLRRLERIPHGVDTRRFATPVARPEDLDPSLQPGRYFLFLGRLDRRKGVDVLLRAFARVAARCPIGLAVAGAGAEQSALESLSAHLGIEGRVCFVGQVETARKTYLLQNALATVMPSRQWEAFPLVLLESFAAGRPVIGTRLPGIGDVIEPGRTGFVVPPEYTGPLEEALVEAAGDPARMDAFGAEARRTAQHYEWAGIARRHLALFTELAGRKRLAA
ncbi:MAG: glycosyltransferase family 4 protein [Thermoguttaceae bacterium]|jgi:glycosyltransferase involved in cell wall biosynthesis